MRFLGNIYTFFFLSKYIFFYTIFYFIKFSFQPPKLNTYYNIIKWSIKNTSNYWVRSLFDYFKKYSQIKYFFELLDRIW